jgi:hypothetical protein
MICCGKAVGNHPRLACGRSGRGPVLEGIAGVLNDNPTLPAPVQCRQVKTGAEQSHSLFWERPRSSPDCYQWGGSGRPAQFVPGRPWACGTNDFLRDRDATTEFIRGTARLMCIDRDRHTTNNASSRQS